MELGNEHIKQEKGAVARSRNKEQSKELEQGSRSKKQE